MKPVAEETRAPDNAANNSVGTPVHVANKQLRAALLKRVPQDSKLGRLTKVDAVSEGDNVGREEIDATIAELCDKDGDFGWVTNTGAVYLFSKASIKPEQARRLARIDQFQIRLLKQVTQDSQLAGKATRVESVRENTVPTPSSDELKACLADIAQDEQRKDIKQLTAYSGALYLYSDSCLTKEEAQKSARIQEFHFNVLTTIREDSKYKSRLTRADALKTLVPDIQPGELETACAQVTDKYPDVKSLVAKTGVVYLFSNEHVTEEYAGILVRVESNDPCFIIAETVREESRVYPRPTDIELFKYGLFNIDRPRMEEYLKQTLEQYEDIEILRFPDGPTYLYSNLYMTETEAIDFIDAVRRSRRD